MDAGMVGADADAMTATGRWFLRSADGLRRHRTQLDSVFRGTGWAGADAERSRAEWAAVGGPALVRVGEFVEHLGRQLLDHAAEQRVASAPAPTVGFAVVGAAERVRDSIGEWLAAGSDEGPAPRDDGPLVDGPQVGLRPSRFATPDSGRDAVVSAMDGLADERRIGRDEIEIRALDNGRYVVVLPGVTDLSDGAGRFVDQIRRDGLLGAPGAGRDAIDAWADNDEPTVRKMRYAYEAALRDDSTVNEYSVVTIDALERAGVPAGAEVMIIGHSFGAYTAMDLAADPAFNMAHGADPVGYHVDVTHVVAAGAETDWRFDDVPAGTNTLVVNNRFDGVYRAEDLLHDDGHARHDGHVEQNFWGGWKGFGHDEHNYIDWLSSTGDDDVEAWLADADDYASGGTRTSAQVLDPNLP